MNKGFTLVEILVVFSIMAVITGIVIFNIGSERKNSALFRSAQNLSLNLRRVENYALSSKTFKTSEVPCGWGIYFDNDTSPKGYVIFADKAMRADCSDRDFRRASDGSEDFETINFDSQVTISSLSNGLSNVVFSPPEPSVVFVPDQTTASITLRVADSVTRRGLWTVITKYQFLVVNVNKTGFISSPQ